MILTADDNLREQFRGRSTVRQIQYAAALAGETAGSTLEQLRRTQLHVLAEQIHALDRMLKVNLADPCLVRTMCPALLDQPGIGPVTAAIALSAWSHQVVSAAKPPSPPSPESAPSPPAPGAPSATA